MADSILKEVTFTPNVFDRNVAMESKQKFERLLNALENLLDSGIIIGLTKQWQVKINELIQRYDDYDKDEIEEIFKQLDNRNRLALYPENRILEDNEDNEDDWIKQANKLNQKRKFNVIVASKDTLTTTPIENLPRNFFNNRGAVVARQTEEFMNKMLGPILSYADKVTIFDPYFSLEHDRYKNALEIICENLANHHGVKDEAVIYIQTSIKSMMTSREFDWKVANQWPKIIKKYEDKYGHILTLNIWEELNNDRWHERWLITNQCGIFMGIGSSISDWTDSTWSLLDWRELSNIASKFNINRSKYNHIGDVTSKGIRKNQNPKNTSTAMTQKERELKRKEDLEKNEQNEKNRLERINNTKTEIVAGGIRRKVQN